MLSCGKGLLPRRGLSVNQQTRSIHLEQQSASGKHDVCGHPCPHQSGLCLDRSRCAHILILDEEPEGSLLSVARMLADHYLQIRLLHVSCVALSGLLFATRGLLRIVDHPLANHPRARYLSYLIDTTLLAAALLLAWMLHQYPFRDAWLTTKVLLLVLYIGLGIFALKRARSRGARIWALAAALATYASIVGVAIAHHPAGWLIYLRPSFGSP